MACSSSSFSSSPRSTHTATTAAPHLDVWRAAREGDLSLLKYLVEERGFPINATNEVNSTPLYYASLTGQLECVNYLISKGAMANDLEFQGERVYYAALNDDLRRLLKKSKMNRAYRDPFLEDLRLIWENAKAFPDLCFACSNEDEMGEEEKGEGDSSNNVLVCHRVILRARSDYFAAKLKQGWKHKKVIPLRRSKEAFCHLLQYLYCGKLEVPMHQLRELGKLVKALQLDDLKREIQYKLLDDDEGDGAEQEEEEEKEKGKDERHTHIDANKLFILEPNKVAVVEHFRALAREVVSSFEADADVVVFTQDGRSFALHKVMLVGRSPYFATMFASGFREGGAGGEQEKVAEKIEETEGGGRSVLPSVHLSVSSEAFIRVIEYIYCDEVLSPLGVPLIFDVLDAATLFMLPGLRTRCGAILMEEEIASLVDPFYLHEASRLYALPRLENFALSRFAADLEAVIWEEEFAALVKESASSIEERQEVDSVPFVDDIRFFVLQRDRCDQGRMRKKLGMIEELLHRLDLDA